MVMGNQFYNIETRVATTGDLAKVPGKAGKRVFVTGTNKFYYWAPNRTWTEESGGGLPYRYYSCQLFQFGTGNAWDNVLGEHTFDDFITWTRLSNGVYSGTLEGAFPADRTMFLYSGFAGGVNASPAISPSFVSVLRADDDTIIVNAMNSSFAPQDGLVAFNLEIRVYDVNYFRD